MSSIPFNLNPKLQGIRFRGKHRLGLGQQLRQQLRQHVEQKVGSELDSIKAVPKYKFHTKTSTDSKVSPSATLTPTAGLTPTQIRTAYGLNNVPENGTGVIIGVVDAYLYSSAQADFVAYDSFYNLGNPNALTVYSLGKVSNASWSLEQSLDIQAIHAVAPMAKIYLIQAASDSLTDLLAGVQKAVSLGCGIISCSWGSPEFSTENNYASYFSAANTVFLASAGDSDDIVNWPSVLSDVISVGGSTLNVSATGTRISETVWSDTGCGPSVYIAIPSYQSGAGISGSKDLPLILLRMPTQSTGINIINTAYIGTQTFFEVGGTSLSAPIWAGIIGLANQAGKH